ncbi:MAG TPA: TatD family hydrolase, partial [Lacipirellulaceae bacterium]
MITLFDTHSHLDQPEFDADRADVVARAHDAGVMKMIAIGTSAPTSEICVRLAAEYEAVYAAVGMQPNYIAESQPGDWDCIVELVGQPGVVAIGETGLDRHWDFTPFDQQQDYFDRHIRLSQERGLPFVVHMRDCDEDILVMLREARTRGPLC